MKKLLPTLVPVLTLLGVSFAPVMQGVISNHPVLAVTLGSVLAVVNHWLPSPSSN